MRTDPSPDALDDLVTYSRLLGADPTLVLHGGGNTSVKTTRTDITGALVPTLYVKGSGADLATVERSDFAPLRLERLTQLLPPTMIPDDVLLSELRCALLDAGAPDPSVETLVHALLDDAAVMHSHADAVLALTNVPQGREVAQDLLGDRVAVVDYAMPGPDLVAACARAWAGRPAAAIGLLVLGHGLFTVGDTARTAYQRHLDIVTLCRSRLPQPATTPAGDPPPPVDAEALARRRAQLCALAGRPMIMATDRSPEARDFAADPACRDAAGRGPVTPDHVIWTGRVPLVGDDAAAYERDYRAYFEAHRHRRGDPTMADPAPRVILDPALGMATLGRTAREAAIAADIYRHTMEVIRLAEAAGGYRPADAGHVFDLEYWPLQREKLRRADASRPPLRGQVALVTGAASGIGKACAQALLDAGATVVGWDRSPGVADTFRGSAWLGLQVDVTDPDAMRAALDTQVLAFGGLDILVVAAGIFPTAAHLGELTREAWRRTMAVNVDSVADLYGLAYPLLRHAPAGGRVVVIASKNVPAPGPGAAAYSSSKAALTQLSRVAALEWADAGIRVNMLHPDAVFDTGLWTPELLAARAEHYGMSVADYKRRNLLHAEVTSARVGELATAMATDLFAATTGAQVPIDGGNERVI